MNKKMTPLRDIEDNREFWKGTRFRKYGVGLNVKNKDEDYYEYMLTEIPPKRDRMMLTHVNGYKSGSVISFIKTSETTKFVVSGKEIKNCLGLINTYLIEEISDH
jgi:hypothetical protein